MNNASHVFICESTEGCYVAVTHSAFLWAGHCNGSNARSRYVDVTLGMGKVTLFGLTTYCSRTGQSGWKSP
jgi:hypothetical protein